MRHKIFFNLILSGKFIGVCAFDECKFIKKGVAL